MKVKIITAMGEETVENKVNEFISNPKIKVNKLDFTGSIWYIGVMITYEEL